MPKQLVSTSSAPTTGFTPGGAVSPLAQAIRFGNMLFVSGTGSLDPSIPIHYQLHGEDARLRYALSNSFGFGGSNCSLVLGVAQ